MCDIDPSHDEMGWSYLENRAFCPDCEPTMLGVQVQFVQTMRAVSERIKAMEGLKLVQCPSCSKIHAVLCPRCFQLHPDPEG